MPQLTETFSPTPTAAADPRHALRDLHVIRGAFSLVWVATTLTTSASLEGKDTPTAIAAALLVIYPAWDVVATFLERRVGGNVAAGRVSAVNIALGLAATAAMVIAISSTISSTLLVFGTWALLAGAVQLVVALRRRQTVGNQWPMIISGALSVLAGATFAAMSGSGTSTLSGIAGYSAFGAFWFAVSAVALSRRSAPRAGRSSRRG
jgi:uncharacterized membrane protein HdeD (DUF308 family)